MIGTRYRRWVVLLLGLAAVAAACGTIEVPFTPDDSPSGGGSSASSGGGTDGSDDESSGGTGSTPAVGGSGGVGGDLGQGDDGSTGFGAMGGFGGSQGDLLYAGGSRIRGVAATESYVYWLEYGTFDQLDNYQFDGALVRMELASGDVQTLAEDLEGPIQLGITTEEAFILLDRSTHSDPDGEVAVGRVSLSGGSLELVEHEGSYDYPFSMASYEDRAYFGARVLGTWTIREYVPGEEGREVLPYHPSGPGLLPAAMAADDSHLYFVDVTNGAFFRQALLIDEDAESLSGANYHTLALQGDRVLTTRGQEPMYLAAMSKDGGAWANILRLGEHYDCVRLTIVGPRFLAECQQMTGSPYVLTSPWGGGQPMRSYPLTIARAWAATEGVLFIGWKDDLFQIALD